MNPSKTGKNYEETKESEKKASETESEEMHRGKLFIAKLIQSATSLNSMTNLGGKLTCAQVAKRKSASYNFNPTILNNSNEFQDYLNTLKNSLHPLRERFVVTERHWVAGDININSYGQTSVLFMDSLGIGNIKEYETYGYIVQFANTFKDSTIYVPTLQRQRDFESCRVFALDDLRHFYTIEHYLEEKFKSSGLHGYLADSAQRLAETTTFKRDELITRCEVPLPFIRTMQYRHMVFDTVLQQRSPEEKAVPVNKKGELLTSEYAAENFYDESMDEGLRIKQIFEKIAKFNLSFIKEVHDYKKLKLAMEPFTLNGFKQRIAQKNASLLPSRSFSVSDKSTLNSVEEIVEEPARKRQKLR